MKHPGGVPMFPRNANAPDTYLSSAGRLRVRRELSGGRVPSLDFRTTSARRVHRPGDGDQRRRFWIAPFLVAYKSPDSEKLSAYECGFNPFDDRAHEIRPCDSISCRCCSSSSISKSRFCFRGRWRFTTSEPWLWSMIIFLKVLTIGFVYEWNRERWNGIDRGPSSRRPARHSRSRHRQGRSARTILLRRRHDQLADKGVFRHLDRRLIQWARTGSLMWMTFVWRAAPSK